MIIALIVIASIVALYFISQALSTPRALPQAPAVQPAKVTVVAVKTAPVKKVVSKKTAKKVVAKRK